MDKEGKLNDIEESVIEKEKKKNETAFIKSP